MLDLKEDKGTEYIIVWKSKRLFKSRLHSLLFFCLTIQFEYIIGIQFNNCTSVIEKNSYSTKTINAYHVCDLDYWLRNMLYNFVLDIACFVQLVL